MLPRLAVIPVLLAAVLGAALAAREAAADKVATFTGATIKREPQLPPGPPGTDPIPLDIDPNNPPQDTTDYSIPPGSLVRITVTGTTSEAGSPVLHLFDDDVDEAGRGADDELDERPEAVPLPAGGAFEIDLFIDCPLGSSAVEGIESSGEQSAEIYVKDGDKRIPAARDLPGGGTMRSWWKIDCDKQTSQTLAPQGGVIHAVWGDSLLIQPGALPVPTDIQMANMFPLLHVDAVPPGFQDISEALTLQPDGLPLLAPAILTFLYTQEEAGETADEATLQVFRYDPNLAQWQPVPGASVDTANNLLSVPIPVLGTYGFATEIAPPVPALSLIGGALTAGLLLLLGSAVQRMRRGRRRDR